MAMEAPPGPGVREPNGNERGAEEGHPQASSDATDRGGGIPLVRTHEAGLVRTSGRENEDVDWEETDKGGMNKKDTSKIKNTLKPIT